MKIEITSNAEAKVEDSIEIDGSKKASFPGQEILLETNSAEVKAFADFGPVLEGIDDLTNGSENIAFPATKEEKDEKFLVLETFLEIGKTEISEVGEDETEEISKGEKKPDVSSPIEVENTIETKEENLEREAVCLFGEDAGPLIRQQDSAIGDIQFR